MYGEESLKALFVGAAAHPIRRTLRYWLAEHQHAFLEDLTQSVEPLLDLQGRRQQKETMNVKQQRYRSARRNSNTQTR